MRRPPSLRARDGAFRPDIEGLRAVAVLAVVLYHAGFLGGGYVGVDVFFVLSGFLITRLLWRELSSSGTVSFARFYGRRARRLLPASALVLVVTIVASRSVLSPLQFRTLIGDGKAAALYVSNLRFAAQRTDYLGAHGPSPLQHYWSLAVEEQFYVVWPLLLYALTRRTTRAAVVVAALASIGGASLLLSIHMTTTNQSWAFFSLPTRAWELAAGALVAFGATRLRTLRASVAAALGWIGLAAIVWSVFRFDASTAFPGTAALLPVMGALAVVIAGCAMPASARGVGLVLDREPMQLLGRISYTWYLWHWPALVLAAVWLGHDLSRVQGLALVVASGGVAYVTTRLVERPVRLSLTLSASARRSLALGAGLTAVALVATYAAAASTPSLAGHGRAVALSPALQGIRPSGAGKGSAAAELSAIDTVLRPIEATVTAAVAPHAVPANLEPALGEAAGDKAEPFNDGCDNTYSDAEVHSCAYADTKSATTVVLFGDSHATQYFPAFDLVAKLKHWRLVVLTKTTCPPFALPVFSPILGRDYRECEQWRAAAFERIRREHPALVVMGVARHYDANYHFTPYDRSWIDGVRTSVRAVRGFGVPVMVLGPTPKPPFDVPSCLSEHLGDAGACATPRAQAVDASGRDRERRVAEGAGARYVGVARWLCSPTTCPAVVGNLLVYRDDNHLTTRFVEWLTPVIAAETDAATAGAPPAR
jgi:peptidoglycan/LPS O-acetylase OafA/YrhL